MMGKFGWMGFEGFWEVDVVGLINVGCCGWVGGWIGMMKRGGLMSMEVLGFGGGLCLDGCIEMQ